MRIKDIADINQKVLSENTPKNFMFRYIDISSVDSNGNISESEPLYFGDAPSRARRVLRVNDIIISTVRTYLKAIAFISPNYKDYIASTGFAVLTPKKDVNPNYIYYGLINNDFIDEVSKNSIGVSYPAITSSELSSLSVPLPSLPVQRRIVSYLDSKTSEIDHAISLLEQKREAYTRLKASVINRAVTRGLNPNVKLKDSGVEWIGKIPEGWKVKRFKEIFTKYTTGATPNSKNVDNFEGNNTWVTIADMTTKYVTESNLCLSDKSIKENQIPITRKGSLMFSFKLSIGKVAFASKDLFTNEAIVTLSPSKKYDLDYFYYYLPLVCDNNATENIYGAKMMNQKIIANMSFALPPLPEQRSIASYLDAECSKIDRAASIVEKQIDAYKRLKRSLINEVVTGKRTKF